MQLIDRDYRGQGAFTMVELIIVVTLIGVMALFAIPNYAKAINKAHEKDATNNLMAIYASEKIYFNANNTYATPALTDSTAHINTNLGLGIIPNGATYACPTGNAAAFDCRADVGGTFVLKVTDLITPPCCFSGACPSAVACS